MAEDGDQAVLHMVLRQNGNQVTGTYSISSDGMEMNDEVQGTIRGDRLVIGDGEMRISPDYNQIILETEDGRVVFQRGK